MGLLLLCCCFVAFVVAVRAPPHTNFERQINGVQARREGASRSPDGANNRGRRRNPIRAHLSDAWMADFGPSDLTSRTILQRMELIRNNQYIALAISLE